MTALKNEFAKLKTGIYPKWHFCRHVIFLLQSFLCPDKSKMTNLLRIGLQAKYCQRFSSILPLDWQLKRHRLVWSRFINSMQIHIFYEHHKLLYLTELFISGHSNHIPALNPDTPVGNLFNLEIGERCRVGY